MRTSNVRYVALAIVCTVFAFFATEASAHEYDFEVDNQCERTITVTLNFTCGQQYTITLPPFTGTTLTLTTNCHIRSAKVGDDVIEPGECVQLTNSCAAALRVASFVAKPSCN